MKKLLSLFLCFSIIGCLVSCGSTTVTSEIVIIEEDENDDSSSKVKDTSSKDNTTSKEQSSSKVEESSSKKENSSEDDQGDKFTIPYYKFTKKNVTLAGKSALDSQGIRLYGAADSFSFTSKCSGDVTIEYSATIKNAEEYQGVYFAVFIDGKRFADRQHIVSSGNGKITLPGVAFGTHTFQIFRQTEHTNDVVYFTGVNISGEVSAPKAKDFSIEFIGDSITAGYESVLDDVEKIDGIFGGSPWYQDSTKTYAFYLAEKVNANISVTAFSGIGIVKGYKSVTMPQIYPYYPDTSMTIATKTINEPDLIIINLGTNDNWNGVSTADFINGAVEFGKSVHEAHPKAKIVFYGGLMIKSDWNNSYAAIASRLGGESSGYYSYVNSFTCNGHPLASEQKAASEELYTFLKGKGLVK